MHIQVVGIDVSKRFHVAWTDGRSFTFSHTLTGFKDLIQWLVESEGSAVYQFGMEPTGRFSKTLSKWLTDHGHQVVFVPGAYTKRAKWFLSNGSNKTDLVDAKVIAELVQQGRYLKTMGKDLAFTELRTLSDLHFRMVKMSVESQNRLHSLIDTVFPELSRFVCVKSKVALRILNAYHQPCEIVAAGWESFRKVAIICHGMNITEEKAQQIFHAAEESVGTGSETLSFELGVQLRLFSDIEQARADIEKQMVNWLHQVDYAEALMSVPGISALAAGLLLGQLGDLCKYPSAKHLVKAVGLNLVEQSSGKFLSRPRISKAGKGQLRNHLYRAALAVFANPKGPLHDWYKERTEKKKPGKIVLVAACRKLLRIAHAVARDNAEYKKLKGRIA